MSDGSDAEVSKPWLMVATVALAAFAGGIVVGRSFNRHDSAAVATTVATTVAGTGHVTAPAGDTGSGDTVTGDTRALAPDLTCQADWMPDAASGWDVSWPVERLSMSFGPTEVWRVTAQPGRASTFAAQGSLGAFGLAAGYTIQGSQPIVGVAGQSATLAISGGGHQASVPCL